MTMSKKEEKGLTNGKTCELLTGSASTRTPISLLLTQEEARNFFLGMLKILYIPRPKSQRNALVQSLSHVCLFATPWTAAHQASLSITNSQSLLKLMSIESVMPSNHLILCRPLLLLPSAFPASGFFQWKVARVDSCFHCYSQDAE